VYAGTHPTNSSTGKPSNDLLYFAKENMLKLVTAPTLALHTAVTNDVCTILTTPWALGWQATYRHCWLHNVSLQYRAIAHMQVCHSKQHF
jgi:hypothetical protein